MLAPDALRLITIETLRPTSAVLAKGGFPTFAGKNVLDSRAVSTQDIDHTQAYTPVLSVHTGTSTNTSRGALADLEDFECECVLDIRAELAIAAEEGGTVYAVPMAATDAEGELVLSALCAQVQFLLERSERGVAWRRIAPRVISLEEMPFEFPDLGLRYLRRTMRYRLQVPGDLFLASEGGLPEPMRSIFEALPEQSYAKAKLAELAGYFTAETAPPLEQLVGEVRIGGEQLQIGVGETEP
ncbi:hypothetical protein [Rhizobium metallidurans]|uniref:Uncharacterized protein n=1 Tax=Rhizobium metallidurans TaxID=1265931 RepID=A0A7W6GBQ4_9HYPH|nr:hypothetical protein [Rhizobium metallidurans]MBB3965948.1 hypothetical protein [Rhizobium metallidurans]